MPFTLLLDYGMNPFRFERQALCTFFLQMVQFLGLQSQFSIPTQTIMGFADEVSLAYRDVRYHSFFHAFSVTQFLFTMLTTSEGVSGILTPEDILAMIVASLLHDADHPGNNNAWEVASKSSLATKYNDTSVLEQHHAAVGMRIMSSDKRNMFATLQDSVQDQVRKGYYRAILQTDMAQHGKIVEDVTARGSGGKEGFDRASAEDRRELMGVLLHSADISNPLLPDFDLARTWAERIKDEFWNQYNNELERSLPPTQMWASLGTEKGFCKSQVGFIDFIVAPLWNSFFTVFPDVVEHGCLPNSLSSNRTRWVKLAEEAEKAEAPGAQGPTPSTATSGGTGVLSTSTTASPTRATSGAVAPNASAAT